jgi:hypothetical protein
MTFSKHQLERNSLDLINGGYFSLLIYLSGKYQRFLIVIYKGRGLSQIIQNGAEPYGFTINF